MLCISQKRQNPFPLVKLLLAISLVVLTEEKWRKKEIMWEGGIVIFLSAFFFVDVSRNASETFCQFVMQVVVRDRGFGIRLVWIVILALPHSLS